MRRAASARVKSGSAPSRAWAQVPEHGRVDGVAGGVQELVVAGAGGQGPLVQPQAEGHRRRGGRLLGVAAGLEPAQGGQEGAPLRSPELELHQGLVLPGNVIGQAPVLQPQLVPQSALHLHPAHVGPGAGGTRDRARLQPGCCRRASSSSASFFSPASRAKSSARGACRRGRGSWRTARRRSSPRFSRLYAHDQGEQGVHPALLVFLIGHLHRVHGLLQLSVQPVQRLLGGGLLSLLHLLQPAAGPAPDSSRA